MSDISSGEMRYFPGCPRLIPDPRNCRPNAKRTKRSRLFRHLHLSSPSQRRRFRSQRSPQLDKTRRRQLLNSTTNSLRSRLLRNPRIPPKRPILPPPHHRPNQRHPPHRLLPSPPPPPPPNQRNLPTNPHPLRRNHHRH